MTVPKEELEEEAAHKHVINVKKMDILLKIVRMKKDKMVEDLYRIRQNASNVIKWVICLVNVPIKEVEEEKELVSIATKLVI